MRMIATWLVACSLVACAPAAVSTPSTEAPAPATPVTAGGATATAPTDLGLVAVDKVAVPALQALTIGELAYNSTANTVKVLTAQGLIHGATATKVRELNTQATSALAFAYGATDDIERARQVAKLYDAIGGLDAIAKPLKGILGSGS